MVMTQHRPFIRTLRAQWLGQRLRDLREQRGMSLELVAEHLNRDRSALGRYERAEWPIQRHDVLALLDLYGFHRASERAQLLSLAEEVWRTDRWTENYGDLVDSSFIDFPWLESRANTVCSYHAMLVPGLFQLREYAELVIRCVEGSNGTEDKVGRWLELRMERQHVLNRANPPALETIIDESVLRRQIGGSVLLRAQLLHLRKIAERPKVEIRILPSQVWLHPGLEGSFWLFRMPKPYPEVAYLEGLAGQMYFEAPKSTRYLDAYDRLREAALDPRESAKLITTIAEEFS
ncbi:helix-turn-helix domain-containing protein [Plantactinospora sp. WMMC1484]|uniref:helix-turn-helix domain-containing protein n=1 Tax=Plantactinospora sp. WMMC1484 TaxID=3404122 RepID=UPI003BF5007C